MGRARAGSLPAVLVACARLLARGAACAGPPFITDDPEPVDLGHWEVYAFSGGRLRRGRATRRRAVDRGQLRRSARTCSCTSSPTSPTTLPDGAPRQYGLGDTELGAKYRLVNPGKDDWYPQVGVFPLVELPTGDAKRGLGAGYVQALLPVWVQKDFGEWTTYGGGGYWINPGPGNRNYWFAGWLLQRQVTKKLALGAEVFRQTSSMVGRDGVDGVQPRRPVRLHRPLPPAVFSRARRSRSTPSTAAR